MLGEFKGRVIVNTWGNTKDAGGGVVKSIASSFELWAKVENRTGQANYVQGQRVADYDYKITVRYYASKIITTANTITYNGQELRINSVQRIDEGKLSFFILRCSLHGNT